MLQTIGLVLFIFSKTFASTVVATYNIRNFDYDTRSHTPTNKSYLAKTIRSTAADIIAVQEIRESDAFKRFISQNFTQYQVVLSTCGGAGKQHLGFVYDQSKFQLIKFSQDLRTSNAFEQQQQDELASCYSGSRPLAIGIFKSLVTKKEIVFYSLHLKSGGSQRSINKRFRQLEILKKSMNHFRKSGYTDFIVMGDFNTTEYLKRSEVYTAFKKVISSAQLLDGAQQAMCSSYWYGGIQDNIEYPSKLDHIFVSRSLAKKKITSKVLEHCSKVACKPTHVSAMGDSYHEVSDHCPIVTTIK